MLGSRGFTEWLLQTTCLSSFSNDGDSNSRAVIRDKGDNIYERPKMVSYTW